MATEPNWQEVEPGPGQFKFEHVGDQLEGVVLRKERQLKYQVGWYVIRTPELKEFGVLGSTQLDRLMGKVRPGEHIKIELTDIEEVPAGHMKHYRVYRAQPTKPIAAG